MILAWPQLRSKVEPPPLVSWDALLHFLQPCWLHKLSHSHPRPSPGLVITKLLLKDTPSSHSLATSSAFPVLSLPSSLGTVLSACSLGSLPRPQLITSTTLPGYLPTPLPPIPHTWGGGQLTASSLLPRVAGATPTRPHCNARVPGVGCSRKATQQAPPSKNVPDSSCLPHPHCHPQGTSPAASEKLWKAAKETARPWPGSLKLPHILASSPLPSGLSLCERPPSIWTLSSPALVSS